MKECIKCGHEIAEDAKYCQYCGKNQDGQFASTVQLISTKTKQAKNYVVHKFLPTVVLRSKQYVSYLFQNTKNPDLEQATSVGYFGFINFLIVTIISGLTISHILALPINYILHKSLLFPLAAEFILWAMLASLINLLLVYFIGNKLYQSKITIGQTFNRIYGPVSVVVYFSLISIVITLAGMNMLGSFLLFVVANVMIHLAFLMTLIQLEKKRKGFNKYYITILAIIISLLINFLLLRIFANIITTKLATGLEQIIIKKINDLFPYLKTLKDFLP